MRAQGEFCTVRNTHNPSKASFVPFAALTSQAGQALSRVRQTSKQEATGPNYSACWRWRGLAAGPVGGGRARGRRRGPWAAAGRGRASRRYTERSSRRGGLAGGQARHHCAQNADHFAYNSPFSVFFTEVVCVLGVTPPETTASQAQARHEAPIRRQHTTRGLHVVQNPHCHTANSRQAGEHHQTG